MNSTAARLTLTNVQKSYQDADRSLVVLNNVTYQFPATGTVAIVGRSGIGKSTLLHLLGGLESPTSGSISYGSECFSSFSVEDRASFRARSVGFIFQFHHLLPEFTALENAAMPLVIQGLTEDEAFGRGEVLLKSLGLSGRLTHRPGQLSGGEQQRVAIARALIARPRIVLADEPTGNLDITTAREVQQLLVDASSEQGSILIVVTHLDELAGGMDSVLEMMPGGQLVQRSSA